MLKETRTPVRGGAIVIGYGIFSYGDDRINQQLTVMDSLTPRSSIYNPAALRTILIVARTASMQEGKHRYSVQTDPIQAIPSHKVGVCPVHWHIYNYDTGLCTECWRTRPGQTGQLGQMSQQVNMTPLVRLFQQTPPSQSNQT